jgi:transcription antitermination protein NusB
MPARHRSRQHALQVLFLWDVRKESIDRAIDSFYATLSSEEDAPGRSQPDPFMEDLVRGVCSKADELDLRISAKSEHWRMDRMPAVDRNLLRLAVYEMTEVGTPPAVVMDEALELAHQFSGDESAAFINGVLDAVHRSARPATAP